MKSIAIVTLLALLIMPCIAVPDSITTGPYKISFDIGLSRGDYIVTVSDPDQKESLSGDISTIYSVKIQNMTGMTQLMMIDITRREEVTPIPNDDELMKLMPIAINQILGATNVEVAVRPIDGTRCGIGSYDFYNAAIGYTKAYLLSYNPMSDKEHTQAVVVSSYPWDRTLSLIRTLHIEYTGSNITQTGSKPYVGPTSAYAGTGQGAKVGMKDANLLDINSGDKPTTTAYQPISNQVQSGRYPANKDTKVYHEAGCTWAGKIKPENLVWFSSPNEAEAAGYRHCEKC
jgi:hypothetical protein